MNNFWARVIIFLIFFPLLFVVIFIIPHLHHLVFNLMLVAVSCIGAFEIKDMFVKKGLPVFSFLAPLFAATLPAAAFLEEIHFLPPQSMLLWMAAIFGVYIVMTIFAPTKEKLLERLPLFSTSVVITFVPAFFLTFLVRITSLSHPQIVLIWFILPVFLNDIFAYLAGKLARGWSRLNLLISPNKTLIGFLVGMAASIGVNVILSLTMTDYYSMSPFAAAVLGTAIGLTAIAGDLFESALKRSGGVKDSGVVMGGRGGIMDAIDSILMSAPLFLLLFPLFALPVKI
jgi:phosphatidate cytidylyltransferase